MGVKYSSLGHSASGSRDCFRGRRATQAVQHILMRDNARRPSLRQTSQTRQRRIAANVIRIGIGIHHPQDRLVA